MSWLFGALPNAHLVASAIADLMFFLTVCHDKNVIDARLVSSFEGVYAPVSSLDVRRTLVGVFANDTKKTAGRNQFCDLHLALQRHVVGCAAWLAHSKRAIM